MVRAMLLAALVVALAGLATAAPASAIIVKLPSGKLLSYEALAGKSPQQSRPLQRRPHDAALSNLDYSGGPVMPSSTNYVIDWEPSNYAGTAHQGAGSQGFAFGVAQFFKDLSAANGTTTNSDSISTQYNDATGDTAAYNTQLGSGGTGANGAYLDTDPLPSNGCSEGTYCITDQQLQNELASYISARGLPSGDLTHEYFVLTPPDVVSCFDEAGTQCSGNALDQGSEAFCGYHSASTAPSLVLYANIPDMDGIDGCDPFATVGVCQIVGTCAYNATFAEGVLSTVAHEHNESITDPLPNTAWTDYQQCGQGDPETCGGEIGDKCSGDEDQDLASVYPVSSGFTVPSNEVINGHHYWLQMEWSNQGAGCAGSLNALGGLQSAPGASFAVKGDQTTADTDLFDATGSGAGIAHYVWQFTDADGGAQNTTVETSTPTVSHTFPAAGSYIVALTTMAANGRSLGTAKQTIAAGLSQAGFSVAAPSLLEGSAVSFNAGSTTHDASVPISSYSWNFGDGSALATGVTTAHSFKAGAHTATLVVTDALGRVSTASTTLRVADRRPTASFKAPSGKAGSKLAFTGHGSDDEAISYLWKFGDGHSAKGAKVKHTFKRKGRYRVTLKITDASGLSVSVTHVVKVSAPKRRR
jgi:hypothetical protein